MNRIGNNNPSIYHHDYEAMESEQHPAPSSSGLPTAAAAPGSAPGARAAVAAPPQGPSALPLRERALGKHPREDQGVPGPRTPPGLRQNLTIRIPEPDSPLPDEYTSPNGRTIYERGGEALRLKNGEVLYHAGAERGILSDEVQAGHSGFNLNRPSKTSVEEDQESPLRLLVDQEKGVPSLIKAGEEIGNKWYFRSVRADYRLRDKISDSIKDQPGPGEFQDDGSYKSPRGTIYERGSEDLELKDGAALYHYGDKRGILSDDAQAGRSGFDLRQQPSTPLTGYRRKAMERLVHPEKGFRSLRKAGKAINAERLFEYASWTLKRPSRAKPAAKPQEEDSPQREIQQRPGAFQLDGSYHSPEGTRYTDQGDALKLKDETVAYLSDNKKRVVLSRDAKAGNSGVDLRIPPKTRNTEERESVIRQLVNEDTGLRNLSKASVAVGENESFFKTQRLVVLRQSRAKQAAKPQGEEPRQGKTRQRRGLPQLNAGRRREELSPALVQAHMHSPMDPETRQAMEHLQQTLKNHPPEVQQRLRDELPHETRQQLQQLDEQQLGELLKPVRDSLAIGEADNAGPLGHLEAMSPSWEEDLWGAHAASRTAEGVAGDILGMHDEGLDSHAIAGQIADDLDFYLDPDLIQETINANRAANQAPAPASAAESSAAGQARGSHRAPSRDELVRQHRAEVLIRIEDKLSDKQIRAYVPTLTLDEIKEIREKWEEQPGMIW